MHLGPETVARLRSVIMAGLPNGKRLILLRRMLALGAGALIAATLGPRNVAVAAD